jgi:hypothetical protein
MPYLQPIRNEDACRLGSRREEQMAETNSAIAQILAQGPVVPVIVIEDVVHAVPLAKALVVGVRVLEVTLRTEASCAICFLPRRTCPLTSARSRRSTSAAI